MKTRKEWIDTLPEDIRKRAYKYQKQRYWMIDENSLQESIMGAFFWIETSEGHLFWSLVAKGKFDEARELFINKTNTTKP